MTTQVPSGSILLTIVRGLVRLPVERPSLVLPVVLLVAGPAATFRGLVFLLRAGLGRAPVGLLRPFTVPVNALLLVPLSTHLLGG
jgi:hypothetical protein